ncbi:hypothetical protein EV204_104301, partial [Tissierella praeacuta]|uniref:hypothetical protein n=1 Tax=Tissierella praeacuta TaxID=43131 RepID=UPI0010EE2F96
YQIGGKIYMETEKKLKYMLDEIVELNDIIKKGKEAMEKRNRLRKEVSSLMGNYMEVVNELS